MKLYILIVTMTLVTTMAAAQVGINNPNPDASAVLDLKSTDKGFLPPRMTQIQLDDIMNPAEGLLVSCLDCEVAGLQQFINGAWEAISNNNANNNEAANYGTVVNPITGKIWLDRNLGATQVATSSNDAASYGHLYQWGRGPDGHEIRTSPTSSVQATTWMTSAGSWNGTFITTFSHWLTMDPVENHMWSGRSAENNVCPSGFRIPTNSEWEQERRTWVSNDAAGAFASPLKLPKAGFRINVNGGIWEMTVTGLYWSSTVDSSSNNARYLVFQDILAYSSTNHNANGGSIRCIKD